MRHEILLAAAAMLALTSCSKNTPTASGLDPEAFVAEAEGGSTALYTLTNKAGMEVCITNFGARIVSLMVPDRDGKMRDVVLGFDNIRDYIDNPSAFGAVMGRYANRIGGAAFTLDGTTYQLPKNNGENCIHGGPRSWQYAAFSAEQQGADRLVLNLVSPAGEFGFPGTVNFKVTYSLSEDNSLKVSYDAETDAPTVLNVTNHSFFNLAGDPSCTAEDWTLQIDADTVTPTDDAQIPTGEFMPVAGTPFDFRTARALGEGMFDENDPQIAVAHGYDHNFVLNHPGELQRPAAVCCCPSNGITMTVYTQEPGIQVYSANNVNEELVGKGGVNLKKRSAICLETQHFPDSPNKSQFPSTELRPGTPFHSETIFAFSVLK